MEKKKPKNFIIADLCFNSAAAAKESNTSLEDFNQKIISNWNAAVEEDDQVFVLGKFIMGTISQIRDLVAKLNGNIILCSAQDAKERLPVNIWEMLGIKVYENNITYFNKNGTTYYYSNNNKDFDCKNSKIKLTTEEVETPFYLKDGDRCFSLNAKIWDWNPVNLENIIQMVEE